MRYADDFVMGFEKEADAREMLLALKERRGRFGLALLEDKTRLIEFCRFRGFDETAAWRAASQGLRLSGIHPLFWEDPGRPVYREA
jgi:hypothetical protein